MREGTAHPGGPWEVSSHVGTAGSSATPAPGFLPPVAPPPPPLTPPSALTRNGWLGCCRALVLLPNAPRTGGRLVLLSALKELVLLPPQPPPPPPNVPGARCCCPPAHHVGAAARLSTWGKRMRNVTQCRLVEGVATAIELHTWDSCVLYVI